MPLLGSGTSMRTRLVVSCALAILPSRLHLLLGRLLLGWEVGANVRIGHSVLHARRVRLGDDTYVGSMSLVKGLEELSLDEGAAIGPFNWISGPPIESDTFPNSPNRYPALLMGAHAVVTQRHLVDCSDRVVMEAFSGLAGARTVVLTHSVNVVRNIQQAIPVVIGERAVILTSCVVLPGSTVAARAVVAAGSVVAGALTTEQALYRGNPAELVRELPSRYAFFTRTGRVI